MLKKIWIYFVYRIIRSIVSQDGWIKTVYSLFSLHCLLINESFSLTHVRIWPVRKLRTSLIKFSFSLTHTCP